MTSTNTLQNGKWHLADWRRHAMQLYPSIPILGDRLGVWSSVAGGTCWDPSLSNMSISPEKSCRPCLWGHILLCSCTERASEATWAPTGALPDKLPIGKQCVPSNKSIRVLNNYVLIEWRGLSKRNIIRNQFNYYKFLAQLQSLK